MPGPGLRERKKAQTRQRLADVAFALFRERGFDNVSVAEIADASDVAVSTLFAYFPSKEALVFDEDQAHEQRLVGMVRGRAEGVSIMDALEAQAESLMAGLLVDRATVEQFQELLAATPQLRDYFERIRRRWEKSLAVAIAQEAGLPDDDVSAAALARYVMGAVELGHDSGDPRAAMPVLFARLRRGWPDFC
ncbi:DNA-binding transcriptional regulator, AcrR family [Amycolatopsis pretoriensis]|uniref:DNA-binding transcriptional regulator, AcrR family n=1 Tax=Amycolatopsis pretoriensis TaxID=218821 RepID=A0A1H5QK36_9PSEU|nr:TetR family transcriptional regulator [Amycolatopsis pretoriensis]SEF26523.1 DNA-binding transcriptional regulator, AcrR family [Amycolatopsis pretoriensis]